MELFLCPSEPDTFLVYTGGYKGGPSNYGYAARAGGSWEGCNPDVWDEYQPLRLSRVAWPSEALIIVDVENPVPAWGAWWEFSTRHRGGTNLLFLDNHIEWVVSPPPWGNTGRPGAPGFGYYWTWAWGDGDDWF